MPADEALAALAARVAAFHITDRRMRHAQAEVERALRAGQVDARVRADYLAAVRRYFGAFQLEAKAQLHDVDRRLVHVNQVHFNLTAERGVVVKRIEATEAVLNAAGAVGELAAP